MMHDFGEAFTGDIPAFDKTSDDENTEENVIKEWIDSLPEPYRTELAELFAEMKERKTTEAKLYKMCIRDRFCIVDCGANIDCKADRFVDFARLGVAYMKTLGIENPTVATLSNGIEAGKGSDVIKEAHELLEK